MYATITENQSSHVRLQVSVLPWRGGVGFGHKKLQFFEPNSSQLGLENTLTLIKYP